MKILLELNNSSTERDNPETSLGWSTTVPNSLFIVERKCMKLLNIGDGYANELHSINLSQSNICTSWSWNKPANQLAFVLNKKSVYIWVPATNTFDQIRPALPQPKSKTNKTIKSKDVEVIKWSNVSDTLLICYSTGQLLLHKNNSKWEKFIDNSDGVLTKVTYVECSDHLDCFGCITETYEILVMTFVGIAKFYMRGDLIRVTQLKFSPVLSKATSLTKKKSTTSMEQAKFFIAYHSESNKIYLNELNEQTFNNISPETNLVYNELDGLPDVLLVDFFWLSDSQLVICLNNGIIRLVQVKLSADNQLTLLCDKLLDMTEQDVNIQQLKFYTLKRFPRSLTSSAMSETMYFLAVCSHSLYYYEIFKTNSKQQYTFEQVDHLDLQESFSKVEVELEFVKFNCDGSMLAMQLTNGYLLIYQSRLQDLMVTKHGGRIGYLSSPTEITVLNYGSTIEMNDAPGSTDNALTFPIDFKPSVIAVGPSHLAIALNNRIRFYLLNDCQSGSLNKSDTNHGSLLEERNCMSIVTGLSLCSRFVVVQFDDHRLKLQHLKSRFESDENDSISSTSDPEGNERFFPDPTNPKRIFSFLLTEHLLIYSTEELEIVVFSLEYWTIIQTCECSKFLMKIPIEKLVSNIRENKFICLPTKDRADNSGSIFIYDLFSNSMIRVLEECSFSGISEKQSVVYSCSKGVVTSLDNPWSYSQVRKLDQVYDAVWDTDGRTLILVEPKRIVVLASLDHTLGRTDFAIEFVGTSRKCMSYNVLYSSQGIVSFQTPLGRVINMVLETHDDEQKLTRLEQQIISSMGSNEEEDPLQKQKSIINMKLAYLKTILPIYSLTKCKQICRYLMEEETLNYPIQERYAELDDVIWKHLAAWALYTMQLNFALIIYRKYQLLVHAQVLSDIIKDIRLNGFDTKASLKTKLYVLLGCEL